MTNEPRQAFPADRGIRKIAVISRYLYLLEGPLGATSSGTIEPPETIGELQEGRRRFSALRGGGDGWKWTDVHHLNDFPYGRFYWGSARAGHGWKFLRDRCRNLSRARYDLQSNPGGSAEHHL